MRVKHAPLCARSLPLGMHDCMRLRVPALHARMWLENSAKTEIVDLFGKIGNIFREHTSRILSVTFFMIILSYIYVIYVIFYIYIYLYYVLYIIFFKYNYVKFYSRMIERTWS